MITLVVPYYDKNLPNKKEYLLKLVESFTGHYDNLIVVHGNDISQYEAINKGFEMASSEYVIVLNDDCTYGTGNLSDLFVPDTLTVPLINDQDHGIAMHAFCLSKKMWESIGGFDGSYRHGYFDDNDAITSLVEKGYKTQVIGSVNVLHPQNGGTTLEALMKTDGNFFKENQDKFLKKWGRLP